MHNNLLKRISRIGCATLLVALCALAQDHKWAGRTLDAFEWTIHERLAELPFQGVFDTLRFDVQGKAVTLSGQVVKDSVKQNAERAVDEIERVAKDRRFVQVLLLVGGELTLGRRQVNLHRIRHTGERGQGNGD